MTNAKHTSLIDALCAVEAYPHKVTSVRVIETHISWVLLTGQFAYKIKKPVNFGFLDFSTLAKRQFYCQEEIRLNQRLAKDWYLEVVSITGQPDHPKISGTGQTIEYAVKMRQFPKVQTLRESAENGVLGANEIDQIADRVAEFHLSIEKVGDSSPYGNSGDIKHWFDENFFHIRPLLTDQKQTLQLDALESWSHNEWSNKSSVFQQRKQQAYVRECHGDLHLANMTLIDGNVVLFDCIEFNPMLRWIDVISEVALLVMDLLHLGYDNYAYRFLNRYLQHTGDYHGLQLLRYYLMYRALVRAKVTLLRKAQESNADLCAQIHDEYLAFANLAQRFIQNNPPVLIITHGISGSGKSTYARQLAENLGAIQIRSDVERKRLFGYSAQTNTGNAVDSGIYAQEAGQKTYSYLLELAGIVLNAGFSVIIDATFLKSEQRNLFLQLAKKCKVDFKIIYFQTSEAELFRRIQQRQNDPSEATVEVLHQQMQTVQPLSDVEKPYVIEVNTEDEKALEKLLVFNI